MRTEWFPLVNEKGETIGKATRKECHSGSKLLHPVIHLHIFNKDGDLYLQKRSMNKDIQPGKWDTAVGGHIDYGESVEEALRREVREELEVDINVGDLIETIEYDYPAFHLSMKCFACTIAGGSPHLLEHEAAKWLTSMQLGSVDWLPADVTLIPKIEKMLEG